MIAPHKLLPGLWKSDKRRTLANLQRYRSMRGAKKRRFAALFGQLEHRFTAKYIHVKLRDFTYKVRYEVLATDATSVVIRIQEDGLRKKMEPIMGPDAEGLFNPKLQHITFVRRRGRQYFWIGLGIYCEWFQKQRVKSRSRSPLRV